MEKDKIMLFIPYLQRIIKAMSEFNVINLGPKTGMGNGILMNGYEYSRFQRLMCAHIDQSVIYV